VWSSQVYVDGSDPVLTATLNCRVRLEERAVYAKVWTSNEPAAWMLVNTTTDQSGIQGQLVSLGMFTQTESQADGVNYSRADYDRITIIEGCANGTTSTTFGAT
jgi:hypothetical protein